MRRTQGAGPAMTRARSFFMLKICLSDEYFVISGEHTKMVKNISVALTGILMLVGKVYSQDIFIGSQLEMAWQTPKEFRVPESVCYDEKRQVLYISNIDGKPKDKDGNGYLSKCTVEGNILVQKWVVGLNAPKGMGVYGDVLYVTDIDRVAAIDIGKSQIIRFYKFDQAKFLNDIAIDRYGNVYVSDMMDTRIYRINNNQASVWIDDPLLTSPNGLFADEKELLIGCQKIVKVGYADEKIRIWITGTGSIDGLEGTGDSRYLFSDWTGHVFLLNDDESITMILDLTPAGMNAADIEYIPASHLLLVPTFNDNRILAFKLLK